MPVLDRDGGTGFVLYRKDRVRCTKGEALLREYRLKPESTTRRVLATCCNSAMFLALDKGHWLSLYRNRFANGAPPVEVRTMTKDRRPGVEFVDDYVPSPATHSAKFMWKLLRSLGGDGISHTRHYLRKGTAMKEPVARVAMQNIKSPGHVVRVDAAKYEAMKCAILAVLPRESPGLTVAELKQHVLPQLPEDLYPGGAKRGMVVEGRAARPRSKRRNRSRGHEAPSPARHRARSSQERTCEIGRLGSKRSALCASHIPKVGDSYQDECFSVISMVRIFTIVKEPL